MLHTHRAAQCQHDRPHLLAGCSATGLLMTSGPRLALVACALLPLLQLSSCLGEQLQPGQQLPRVWATCSQGAGTVAADWAVSQVCSLAEDPSEGCRPCGAADLPGHTPLDVADLVRQVVQTFEACPASAQGSPSG